MGTSGRHSHIHFVSRQMGSHDLSCLCFQPLARRTQTHQMKANRVPLFVATSPKSACGAFDRPPREQPRNRGAETMKRKTNKKRSQQEQLKNTNTRTRTLRKKSSRVDQGASQAPRARRTKRPTRRCQRRTEARWRRATAPRIPEPTATKKLFAFRITRRGRQADVRLGG